MAKTKEEMSQLRFKDYYQLVNGLVKRLEKHDGV